MEANTAPALVLAQNPPAKAAAPTPPAVPAHIVQAAPPAIKPMPASPAPSEAAPKTAPTVAPATTPTVTDSGKDIADITTVDGNAPTTAPIDTEAEANQTARIIELWATQKNGFAAVRRTRAQLKELRLELGASLSAMKSLLARTGRGGGWAAYLRAQKLPLTSADRLVAQHEATLTPREEKLTNGEFTVEEARKLAQKMLPRLCRVLTTAELAYAFIDEIFWNLEASDGRETDDGFEVFRTLHDNDADDEDQSAELAEAAPAAA